MDQTFNDVVQVAVDAYHGNVTKYSNNQSMELLRQALIDANDGSTKLNYKAIRDGKCNGVFALVEEILSRTVVEGLQGDEFFNQLVDFRNVALGDENAFNVEDSDLFVVAKAAEGTQGIRRQRIGGVAQIQIPTELRAVRIYEELNRILSGQVDFNHLIQRVAESFRQQLLNDIYGVWAAATADDFGGATYFPAAGSYDEATLLELIAHVEAAAGGKTATVLGTKAALRSLYPSIEGEASKTDMYNNGYIGKFFGSNVIAMPQRHKVGTTDFVFDDKTLHIIAGDQKPLKGVYEGQSLIIPGDPYRNGDLTQELEYIILM